MSKKCLLKYILIVIALVAGSLFAIFASIHIVRDISADSDAYKNMQSMSAALRIQYAKDHFDNVFQNLSPDKEVILIVNDGNDNSVSIKVPTDSSEAKSILRELIKDDSIADVFIKEKEPVSETEYETEETLVYYIKEGDTLSSISDKVLYSVDELAKYNKIKDVNLIYAGSALRIPKNKTD